MKRKVVIKAIIKCADCPNAINIKETGFECWNRETFRVKIGNVETIPMWCPLPDEKRGEKYELKITPNEYLIAINEAPTTKNVSEEGE